MMIRSACVWLVVVSLSIAALQAQSLAGAAKKAGEASAKSKQADGQKVDKPPTKAYTNKDLAEVPPSTATTTQTDTTDSKTATSGSTSTPASATTPQDERLWRSRARELRRTLADDQTKLAAAKAHYDSLPETAKGAAGAPIVGAWMKAREEISRLTAAVANDQRAISELEDEARRAGVPPGWLRDR